MRSLLSFPATTAAVTSRATWRSLSCVGVTTPHLSKVVLPMTFPLFTSLSVIMPFSTLTRNCAGSGIRESASPSGRGRRCPCASRHMANDIVAIAASIKIIVFISIDEKTAGRRASRKISYYNGLHFADPKHREQPLPPTAVVGFKSTGVAKDRSLAANIDADRALISFKEMPIRQVEANHDALKLARGEIGGLAV